MKEKICYNEKFKKNKSIVDEYDDGPYDYMIVTSPIVEPSHSDEYLDVDESLVEIANEEEGRSVFRMEMNVVEFPMFTKNSNIKINKSITYHFSKDDKSYLEVSPLLNSAIPGEFEEKIFFSILKIFKSKGYKRTFYCTSSEIVRNITNISKTQFFYLNKIKSSIKRLSGCRYVFSNLFYSGLDKKVLEESLHTNLFNYHVFTLKELPESERNNFTDNRVKEVYRIELSDYVYKNLTNKAYLVFEYDKLLEIKNSVARSIYMQITKWRNSKLTLERTAFFIARKIPLSWTNPSKTIKKISVALEELKIIGHISDFEEVCKGKRATTSFKIYFSDEHNTIKQSNFYEDRNTFNSVNDDSFIDYVEEKDTIFLENTKNPTLVVPEQNQIELRNFEKEKESVIKALGPKVATLKTVNSVVSNSLSDHEYEYVLYTAEYTAMYAKQSILKYFKDALANNWADEYIAKKKTKEEKKQVKPEVINTPVSEESEFEIISGHKKYRNTSYSLTDYNNLPADKRNIIFKIVSENFYEKSGGKNPINDGIIKTSLRGLATGFNDLYAELTTSAPEAPKSYIPPEARITPLAKIDVPLVSSIPNKENPRIVEASSILSFLSKVSVFLNDLAISMDGPSCKASLEMFNVIDEEKFYAEYYADKKIGIFYIKNIE